MADPLIQLFAQVLNVDAGAINEESSPDNLEQWDSLAAMHLVAAIEETFDVELTTREIMQMRTVGLAREALRNSGVNV